MGNLACPEQNPVIILGVAFEQLKNSTMEALRRCVLDELLR